MKKGPAKIIFSVGTILFLLHFTCTLGYVLPQSFLPTPLVQISTSYMYPAFFQGWSLFAPDVAHWQGEMYYRVYDDNTWSDWQSSSELPGYSSHPKLRETAEKLNHYLIVQLNEGLYIEDGREVYDNVLLGGHFKSAVHYAMMHHQRLNEGKPDSIQLRMYVDFFEGEVFPPMADRNFDYPKLEVPK